MYTLVPKMTKRAETNKETEAWASLRVIGKISKRQSQSFVPVSEAMKKKYKKTENKVVCALSNSFAKKSSTAQCSRTWRWWEQAQCVDELEEERITEAFCNKPKNG